MLQIVRYPIRDFAFIAEDGQFAFDIEKFAQLRPVIHQLKRAARGNFKRTRIDKIAVRIKSPCDSWSCVR